MERIIRYLIYSLLLSGGIQACGISVLDVDFPTGEPRLVVEGTISNQDKPHSVQLSWSSSLNSKSIEHIDNALVIISSTEGIQDTLKYSTNGRYETQMKGHPESTYQLDILLEGKHYQALSSMPSPAEVDSVSIKFYEENLVREAGYYISLHTLDPDEYEGYYRWKVWRNDTLDRIEGMPGHFATLDLNKDNGWLNLQYPAPFKLGDTIKVQTIKMDKQVYTYYQGLYELMLNDGGLMGPLPVNPATNISGNALGVFQAVYILEKELVVK